MKVLTDAWTIAVMKSVPDMKRNPFILVLLLLLTGGVPLTFVWVFGGPANLPNGLIGAFVSSAPALALFASAQDVNWDNYTKLRQILVAKPISPISYSLGTSVSSLIYSSPGIVVFGALLLQRGLFDAPGAILSLMVMLLAWTAVSSLGFAVAAYLMNASPYRMNAIINLLAFAIVFLHPVYYPAEALGDLSWLSVLIPTSAGATIVRNLAGLTSASNLALLSWLTLVTQAGLFTAIVAVKSRWRES